MKTEKEIKSKIVEVSTFRKQAENEGNGPIYRKWDIVINYLEWVLDKK